MNNYFQNANNYLLINTLYLRDFPSVLFYVNRINRGHPKLNAPYKQYFIKVDAEDMLVQYNKVDNFFASIPPIEYRSLIQSYSDKSEYGYNDTGCFLHEDANQVGFYIIYDYVLIPKDISDDIATGFFQNYYWYMESLPIKYHPEWYEEYVEVFTKYYPAEKEEIDSREKLDLKELIDNYEKALQA